MEDNILQEIELILDSIFYEESGWEIKEAKHQIQALVEQQVLIGRKEALESAKIDKLNISKFTTERAEMYNIACEDYNYAIDQKIADLDRKIKELK